MRSELHSTTPRSNPFIEAFVRAISDIATVFLLLGDLISPRTHTVKKSDHSEPPDVIVGLQPA
jgi:hypothetical protein